ncbi:Retrovirus-related Pol polyprotein from transposon opus, partial [Mucuna pruriens]
MDDFTMYVDTFDACLRNLARVLKRCIETDLVLNFEKCHFMVTEGIVLGHLVSSRGIEVDKAKIDIIASLPNPASVRDVRSFLEHASFYKRFIKNFRKTALSLPKLLQKDVEFVFNKECIQAFEELKTRLTSMPILQAPNWELPFELMCDASNSALGAVLGQQDEVGQPAHVITYEFDQEIRDKKGADNDDPYLWKRDSDQVIRKCIPDSEISSVLHFCHTTAGGGQHGSTRTARKGIDFMGSFPVSNGYSYILLAVDYMSRWVEAVATKANDAKVWCAESSNNDQGSHFCNRAMYSLLEKYGVVHRVAITYHPQTNGQPEVFNREIKKILQKLTNPGRKD